MLPKPLNSAIIYEDKKLYACLANEPITKGHTVVVWKQRTSDLHLLTKKDYEYLMDRVNEIRNAMLKALNVKKIYLVYMDEAKQVHWHLVPRYNIKGYGNFMQKAQETKNLKLKNEIQKHLRIKN